MPILPLTTQQREEYNNVATTPPDAPLGDVIAAMAGGAAQQVTTIAERNALTPGTPGTRVYVADVQTVYELLQDGTSWRAKAIYPTFNATWGGDLIIFYVSTTGSANADGRTISTPKSSLQEVFDDLNACGAVTSSVIIRFAAGTYPTADATLTVEAPGVYIAPMLSSFGTTEEVTKTGNGALAAGKATTREIPTTGFTTFADGERMLWVDSGYGDLLPGFLPQPLGSTTPTLRLADDDAPTWTTAYLQPHDVILDFTTLSDLGLNGLYSKNTALYVLGTHLRVTINSAPRFNNVYCLGCKLTNPGGGPALYYGGDGHLDWYIDFDDGYIDLGAGILYLRGVVGIGGLYNNHVESQVRIADCAFQCYNNVIENLQLGDSTYMDASAGILGPTDFEGGSGIAMTLSQVKLQQRGAWSFAGYAQAIVARQGSMLVGIYAATGACAGVPLELRSGSWANGLASFALTNSVTPGDEVRVGADATIRTFASLPRSDLALGDASELCSARSGT